MGGVLSNDSVQPSRSAQPAPRQPARLIPRPALEPCPPGWEAAWSDTHNRFFYFNRATEERVWTLKDRQPQPAATHFSPSRQAAAQSTPQSAQLQITADAMAALRTHETKLNQLVGSLCPEGRSVYRALQATMSSTAGQEDVVHFESAFRKKLQESMGAGVEIRRIASGQWQCSCRGEEFVVSIRTEVLGASLTEGFAFLSDLKNQARTVRSMLLSDNAQWMRKLSSTMRNGGGKEEFLAACRRSPGDPGNAGGRRRTGPDWDDDLCHWCEKPESSAQLAGKHRCYVAATFRCVACCSKWSSVQARFNPEEERVLGQMCKDCERPGDVLRWNFSAMPEGDNEGSKRERKPHRSDLCEACGSFGNCQGAFFEPFIMSSAIALLTRQGRTSWASSGDVVVANAGLYAVAMLPHISSSQDGQTAFAGGSSWGSKASGKGKANRQSGHDANGGDQGYYKCGDIGHIARNCPSGEGGAKSKGKSTGKGKGKKGKGKGGRGCR